MRILPILLLCWHYLLGSAAVIDADCNDQNVFSAVDEALKSFNNAKEAGNQYILYRITDAKIKHQSKCSAHVLYNKDLKLRSVESQNCSSPEVWTPVTAVHRPCLGCPQPIDKENKELLCFVLSTIEQVNTDANHPFYFDLESIVNATRQVVFGWKYHIQYLIRQTNCSKSNFTNKNSKECKIDKGGESIECNAQVHVTPDDKVHYPLLECKSDTGVCINCPVAVHPEDPELLSLLVQVMDEYNFNSNHTELYDVAYVENAVKKGFQRELYEVTFIIGPTNCSKPDYSILGDGCELIEAAARKSCKTKINVTDKTINVHSAPQCQKATVFMFAVRIGGLSPLRISRNINHEENDRKSMLKLFKPIKRIEQPRQRRHGHNNNKGHKHGNKDKEGKNKHKYQHDDSSEEDNENEVTQAPLQPIEPVIQKPGNLPVVQQAPKVSYNQDISPNTDETSVLDFPELPVDVAPRCPGRVWQPISQIPSIPTAETFKIDDLIFAVDNLNPSSDSDIKKNEPVTPKEISIFNDEDLLGQIKK
ncbi:T-kininogen 1-like isoform X2 [Rhinoderma darwinii]|uniref:T-kininogen 1-like isoform X2 n=1 Tax=Rhinoderma darwinii TaxID=43563 RepID=UPI003F67828C